MLSEAVTKIQTEMSSNNANSYVQAVGNLLLQHLNTHPDDAAFVLGEGKTIVKSLDVMRKTAEKKKVGNCAVLSDAEGLSIVLEYFKSAEPAVQTPSMVAKPAKPAKTEKQKPVKNQAEPEDDLDFDALLM